MGDYRNLRVWQAAHQLACAVQVATQHLPRGYADPGDQLKRAALSIPTNLAEGSSRWRDGDFSRYINIAIGSAAEVESLLLFVRDTGGLSARDADPLLADVLAVRRMLYKLRTAVKGKNEAARPQGAPQTVSEPKSEVRSPESLAEDIGPES